MLHGYSADTTLTPECPPEVATPTPECPPGVDQGNGASGSTPVDPSSVEQVSQCEQESEDGLQGMKCQAPLKEVKVIFL